MSVSLGSDRLLDSGKLRGLRVGVVCNPASINHDFAHIADKVRQSGATLAAIFGPQHGFRSDLQDNMIETPHAEDPRRQVRVYSLYSETREPTAEMMAGLDALVIDLQDIGARIYTFIYTMANCLKACAAFGVPAIVCDRPNPIGGVAVEGPVLDSAYRSFVGLFPIPMRHGMTIGELARLFNDAFGLGADLDVVTMEGWERSAYYDVTGLPWVMPSPNMPALDTAIVYPGTVLFEGSILSEGRGTTRPFELVGAPWIDPEVFADRMNDAGLPGAFFRPVVFEPTFHKHARQACGGCQIHVTDRSRFRPVETGVALLHTFHAVDPDRFGWRPAPYEYEHEKEPIDILYGSDRLRTSLASGASLRQIVEGWEEPLEQFRQLRSGYLLY